MLAIFPSELLFVKKIEKPKVVPQHSTAGTRRRWWDGRRNCCRRGTWREVGVDCHVAGHVPHLGGDDDRDDLDKEHFGVEQGEKSNPKARDEVKHSHLAAHAAHLQKEVARVDPG